MSDIFRDREKGEESKFIHDEELRFKARVRRDRLVGLWVASKFGLKGAEAEAYAKSLIETALEKHGDARLVDRIMADSKARKVELSRHRVLRHIEECDAEARQQIMKEVR